MKVIIKAIMALIFNTIMSLSATQAADYFKDNQTIDDVINPGQFQPQSNVEVIEFFWYGCHFCATFEPQLQTWVNSLPKSVTFKRLPASWNASMTQQQRLYYTLEALNRLDLHQKVFSDIHTRKIKLQTAAQIEQWANKQNINSSDWKNNFNSAAVSQKVNAAQSAYKRFELNWVPVIIINGKRVIAFTDTILIDANKEIQKALRIKKNITKP